MPKGIYPRSDQCKHCVYKKECGKSGYGYLPDDVACMDYYYDGEA